MRKALIILAVVSALWVLPSWLASPARPEPDARTQVARAFGLTPEELDDTADEFFGD